MTAGDSTAGDRNLQQNGSVQKTLPCAIQNANAAMKVGVWMGCINGRLVRRFEDGGELLAELVALVILQAGVCIDLLSVIYLRDIDAPEIAGHTGGFAWSPV